MSGAMAETIPPSLVLILLSDAMMYAHTMAVTATGRSDRVVNTQDIFHAALVPGVAASWRRAFARNSPESRSSSNRSLRWR